MKNIFILFILIFAVNIPFLYAQYGDYYDGKNSYMYDEMPSPDKSSRSYENKKHYIGLSPSLYIPTGENAYIKDYTGVGGGVDVRYKYNLHKLFAVAGTVRYNYAGGSNIQGFTETVTDHHLIDMQFSGVLQYDDVKATKGFIPYISAGVNVTVSVVNSETSTSSYKTDADGAVYIINTVKTNDSNTSANVGFVAGAGLRYAFSNNFTTGIGVDYTYIFTNHDYSGVRIFIDAGYRF